MQELTYVGPHDAVEVDLPLGDPTYTVIIENGGSHEFDDDVAARLLEQPSNWQPTSPAKTPGQMTVPELDAAFGEIDGYPADGKKTDKVTFAQAHTAAADEAADTVDEPAAEPGGDETTTDAA
jgi:hypothetical protein